MTIYVRDRAGVGGQECVLDQCEIERGATAGDMERTSQLSKS